MIWEEGRKKNSPLETPIETPVPFAKKKKSNNKNTMKDGLTSRFGLRTWMQLYYCT